MAFRVFGVSGDSATGFCSSISGGNVISMLKKLKSWLTIANSTKLASSLTAVNPGDFVNFCSSGVKSRAR